MKNHSRRYSKELMQYVRRFRDVLWSPSKISQISVLSRDNKRMAMAGLANLSKYLGCYSYWKTLVKNAGLKWETKVSLDIVLDIMNTNLQDCWVWLKQVLKKLPKAPTMKPCLKPKYIYLLLAFKNNIYFFQNWLC